MIIQAQSAILVLFHRSISVFGILLLATCAYAQLGPPASSSQGATANQLPLSGKAGQTGSVTPIQSPVPGTTASVNTVNPSVQVQGPYSGSMRSTNAMPFSGKLS